MKILITSGGTQVPIDDVRSISNFSQGSFATKLAEEAIKLNHKVHFLYAKHTKAPHVINIDLCKSWLEIHRGYETIFIPSYEELYKKAKRLKSRYIFEEYKTFDEYCKKVHVQCKSEPDIIISAAAVSDFAPMTPQKGKISSESNEIGLTLVPLPKVLSILKRLSPKSFVVGFKLLASHDDDLLLEYARKQQEHGVDLTVGNSYEELKNGNHILRLVKHGKIVETHKKASDLIQTIVKMTNEYRLSLNCSEG